MKCVQSKTDTTQISIALVFAGLLLVLAFSMGDHENSVTLITTVVGAYVIVANMFGTSKSKSC